MKKILIIMCFFLLNIMFSSCTLVSITEEPTDDIVSLQYPDSFDYAKSAGYFPIYTNDNGEIYQYTVYCEWGKMWGIEGTFSKMKKISLYESMTNCHTFGWYYKEDALPEDFPKKEYIVIIQEDNKNIVGCVMIEFVQDDDVYFGYYVEVVYSVSYPKIDGKYQNVRREYIDTKLKEIKERK